MANSDQKLTTEQMCPRCGSNRFSYRAMVLVEGEPKRCVHLWHLGMPREPASPKAREGEPAQDGAEKVSDARLEAIVGAYEEPFDDELRPSLIDYSMARELLQYRQQQSAAAPAPQEADGVELRVGSLEWATSAHSFKNFHRNLCERFGYAHDEQYWWRDLASLEEHIAAQLAQAKKELAVQHRAIEMAIKDGVFHKVWADDYFDRAQRELEKGAAK